MNWLTNFVRPKLRALVARKETPENLWLKCPKCEQMLFMRDWEANQEVCTHCGHHMRIRPLKRLPFLFDDGKYELQPLPRVPADPLKFRDTERYDARLKWLERRTALSSIQIALHEPTSVLDQPGPSPIAEAFAEAWRRAVGVVAWCIASLGVLVPLGLLIGGMVMVVRRLPRLRGAE